MRASVICAAALAIATAVVAAPTAEAGYKSEYRLSTVLGPAFAWGRAGARWAELVRERTDGRINIKLYPGTSLVGGDQSREFTAVRQGIIDLAVGSPINWSPQVKQLNLFALPFLMPDAAAIDALTGGTVGAALFDEIRRRDVVPLAWGENGFREISNSVRPITRPADLEGLKIRFAVSPIFGDTLTALGANPTQMSWADAQPALSTGAVDGQENPLAVFLAAKLHTLNQRYLTLWGYVADPLIFVVARPVWDSWTAEDQEIVRTAAVTAGQENIADVRSGTTADDPVKIVEIERRGVTVTQLSGELKEAFRAATRSVFDKWAAVVGPDLVAQAETAIAAR